MSHRDQCISLDEELDSISTIQSVLSARGIVMGTLDVGGLLMETPNIRGNFYGDNRHK